VPALSIAGRVHILTMAHGSRRPPKIPDVQISRVRFQTLAYPPWAFPRHWGGLNAGSYTPLPLLVCPQPRLLEPPSAFRRFYQAGRHTAEQAAKCPEPLCPTRVLPPLGRRDPSPGRALPLRHRSYWLMRRSRWALSSFGFLASFGESLQVVTSPCCPRQLPDVILRICPWMLDPLPRRYTVCLRLFLPRCHRPSPGNERVGFPHLFRE
jgi:hypothetical protein